MKKNQGKKRDRKRDRSDRTSGGEEVVGRPVGEIDEEPTPGESEPVRKPPWRPDDLK